MRFVRGQYILVSGIGVLILLYVALGVYGIINTNSLNDLYEDSYKNSMSEGIYTVSAYGNMLSVQSFLKDALLGTRKDEIREALDQVNEAGLLIQEDFSRLRNVEDDGFEKNVGLFNAIIDDYAEFERLKDMAFQQLNNGDISSCKNIIRNQLVVAVQYMGDDLKTLVESEREEVKEAYVSYSEVAYYVQMQMMVGFALIITFFVYITFIVRKALIKSKEKLHIEKEELRITIDSIGEGVIVTDLNRIIVKLNKVAEELTHWTSSDATGKLLEDIFMIVDEMTSVPLVSPLQEAIESDLSRTLEKEVVLISKENHERNIAVSASLIKDLYGKATGAVLIFRDISERRKKEDEIYFITYHDQVTKVYNRSFFEKQKSIIDKEQFLPVSVIQGDINGLKLVNDAFGHEKGDELLREAADLLRKYCRKTDYIMRVGGDEFTVFLPKTDNATANSIVKNIEVDIFEREKVTSNTAFFISIALGAATKLDQSESISTVIKKADESMYKKKLLEKKSLHSSVLKSIKSTLAEKSHETEAHATRLIALSKCIAIELELPVEKMYELELLASLHDIGKIGISDQILNKPSALTGEEWIEMKKHPEIGYRIAYSTTELSGIARYILHHHERWDGTGYPQGLSGASIPLLSRIIAVVDSYDAMCDQRTYNVTRTHEEALDEIEKNAGTQFDPDIALIFVKIMRQSL